MLIPGEIPSNGSKMGSLVIIQITFFGCGGIAIGISIAHEVSDIAGMSAFINDWATTARKSDKEISAAVELTRFFPPSDSLSMREREPCEENLIRRFVFDPIKLGALKTRAIQSGVENPTRVEVVTALIYRCEVAAASKLSSAGF